MVQIKEKHQWRETIDELKREQLSEGVRDYLKKFFTKKPVSPASTGPVTPSPERGKQYIDQLNQILDKNQDALGEYIETLNTRSLRNKLEEFNFRSLPPMNKRSKPGEPMPVVPAGGNPPFESPPAQKTPFTAPAPKISPTVPLRAKKKTDLPRNSIFTEARAREWKPRINGLSKVLTDVYNDVLNFLLGIARDSKYTPKNSKDIRSLVSEMKNFSILDKRTLFILRTKLIGFIMTYRNLEGQLKFFNRTFQAQAAAEKKAEKYHIP